MNKYKNFTNMKRTFDIFRLNIPKIWVIASKFSQNEFNVFTFPANFPFKYRPEFDFCLVFFFRSLNFHWNSYQLINRISLVQKRSFNRPRTITFYLCSKTENRKDWKIVILNFSYDEFSIISRVCREMDTFHCPMTRENVRMFNLLLSSFSLRILNDISWKYSDSFLI